MPFTFTSYDAGHKYGIDGLPVTSAQIGDFTAKVGTILSNTNTWGPTIPIGVRGTITVLYSGGYTGEITGTFTSSSAINVSSFIYKWTATNELLFSANGSVNTTIYEANTGKNETWAFAGNDSIYGNSFNNFLKGYGGNDYIDGGPGIDTVYFSGFKSQYSINRSGNSFQVSGPDGGDTLVNIERLQFDDKAIAYDTSGTAGQAYRIYQAAFNRTPDSGGLGFWINSMDHGVPLTTVASGFILSQEFKTTYGINPSNAAFVDKLYQNVLHRAGEPGGVAYWNNELASGHQTMAQVLIGFSESPENQVALIGKIQGGIEYTPII